MIFEWGENKNQANIKKHGINFTDAGYVFSDPFALNIPDHAHSENEERWIISARKSTKNEQRIYEIRCQK